MNEVTTRCPECNGEMLQGFVVDRGHGMSSRVSDWVEGAPEKSMFTGVSAPGDERIPVGTFRCTCLPAVGGAARLPRRVVALVQAAFAVRRAFRAGELDADEQALWGLELEGRLEAAVKGRFPQAYDGV